MFFQNIQRVPFASKRVVSFHFFLIRFNSLLFFLGCFVAVSVTHLSVICPFVIIGFKTLNSLCVTNYLPGLKQLLFVGAKLPMMSSGTEEHGYLEVVEVASCIQCFNSEPQFEF